MMYLRAITADDADITDITAAMTAQIVRILSIASSIQVKPLPQQSRSGSSCFLLVNLRG